MRRLRWQDNWHEVIKALRASGVKIEEWIESGLIPPMVGGMPEPDSGAGGYLSADGLRAGSREIVLQLSPAAATLSAAVEQTFTVPGLQATDRVTAFSPTTSPYSGTSLIGVSFRVSAISVISVAFVNAGTSAGQPTTSARYAIQYQSWRNAS